MKNAAMSSASHQSPVANDSPVPRVNVLGVGVSAINLPQAVRLILDRVASGEGGYVTITGVHGVIESQDSDELKRIHNDAFLVTPDGMPMSWVGWLRGHRTMDRVYGPDLMLELMRETNGRPVRHFFYGGADGVAEALKTSLIQKFPNVSICGTFTPPFRPLTKEEKDGLANLVHEQSPHLIWVGLSTPKQERFMAEFAPRIPHAVFIGVGAAFDFHTGRVRQAPRWMQRAGLEWLFRVTQEPKRLWKRYCLNNPRFLALILLQLSGLRRYPDPQA